MMSLSAPFPLSQREWVWAKGQHHAEDGCPALRWWRRGWAPSGGRGNKPQMWNQPGKWSLQAELTNVFEIKTRYAHRF